MSAKKIVVFEYLGPVLYPAAWVYALSGYKILFLKASKRAGHSPFFKKLVNKGQAEKLISKGFDINRMYAPHRNALRTAETGYHSLIGRRLPDLAGKYVKSSKVELFYKKSLAERLYDLFFVMLKAEEMQEDGKKAVFVPWKTSAVIKNEGKEQKAFKIPLWAGCLSRAVIWYEKARAVIGLPLWMILKAARCKGSNKEKAKYKLGIRVYGTDLGFHFKYRSIDFLLDGKDLSAGNTVFCAETGISSDYRAEFAKRGYKLIDVKDSLRSAGKAFVRKKVLGFMSAFWPVFFLRSLVESEVSVTATMKIIRDEMIWSAFCENNSVENYVSYNDYDAKQIVRNIALSGAGTRTWYYPHTCNDTGLFAPDSSLDLRDYAFSYLFYDRFLSWGARMKKYYSSHINDVKSYDGTGCFWGEHVKDSMENGMAEKFRQKMIKTLNMQPDKILGVFDTSFGGHESLLHEEDMRSFMEGIVWLLDSDPSLAMVLKKKWKWEELKALKPEVKSIYEAIHSHPRCYVTGDDERDSADAMAASDLIISACFTSPTVEALSAGKKAIYFDGAGRLKGFYYDRFPGMVAHGKEELKTAVKSWLAMSGSELDEYVEKYVRPELDLFADGKAITRLRKDLIKKEGWKNGSF